MRLPRPIKNSLLPLLLFFFTQKICAQPSPADDFFNGGAQLYISNNIPAALEKTESGLKIYPDDVKLQKLEKLLKQQQQNQSNQQQQSQKNQQQKPDQGQPQKNQPQPPKENQAPKPPENSSGKPDDEKKEGQDAAAEKAMSPAEAKQLLDRQKGNEQFLRLKPPEKPQENQKPFKDW